VTPVASRPPLARRRAGRVVAGVAGGVADHLQVSVTWVRAGLVALVGVYGSGALAYALLWMFVRPEPRGVPRAVPADERRRAVGLLVLAAGIALLGAVAGHPLSAWVVGPLGVCALGAAIVWREADEAPVAGEPEAPAARVPSRQRSRSGTALLRVLVGALCVLAGMGAFLFGNLRLDQVQFGLLAIIVTVVGVAVLTVPWWLRLARDLGEERRARIVTAERAEIAAHLHDSVLQTLALIQRQAEQPREVLRLARSQERELRAWLHGPDSHRVGAGPRAAGLTEALAAAAAEVEDTYAVTVRPVVVGGDRVLDDRLRALVLAAREAMVNAAKHAGVAEVSVYAEVEQRSEGMAVHVFVRDRGCGFEPQAVPADRHGLAGSVRARMQRHGGTVELRTAPGEGTEVHLSMPAQHPAAEATVVDRSVR